MIDMCYVLVHKAPPFVVLVKQFTDFGQVVNVKGREKIDI